ncbi:hypothetical protein H0I76_02420 [Limibaculum sp. M0105]|uniref:Lysozyme inhibitor LprI N-terminal domain-containing protein n=1 Tax=Thermohalobaculum xanthum TaxID=2753746 RepID=A0A8J7M5A8_9RHOB|nr:hypothetical protein [Thermohalobaculum xanthum]MBK0398032.1 hypothetical protein [Thermohalobaculum xanthum]
MRLALPLAAALAMLAAPQAQAAPAEWAACSAAAGTMRELRRCGTAREDIAGCEIRRPGEPLDAPVQCLDAAAAAWTAIAAAEDRALGPREGRADTDSWLAARAELCRDPVEMERAAALSDELQARFDAAKCELNQAVRRAIDSAALRRGLR